MKKLLILILLFPLLLNAQTPVTKAMSVWARDIVNANFDNIFAEVTGIRNGDSAFSVLVTDTIKIGTDTKIYYDSDSRTNASTTGIADVIVQIGQEMHQLVYNNSGSTIENGKVCYSSGINSTYEIVEIGLADKSSILTSLGTIGVATHDIGDGELGLVTTYGIVRDFDATALTEAFPIYLGDNGNLTPTRPLFPDVIIFLGVCIDNSSLGKIHVSKEYITRTFVAKSYNFTSQGIGAGTYWRAGFYDFSATDANLTQASTAVTYGTANVPYCAHPFAVFGGVGTVDAGQVGLRVTGTSINDAGILTISDADTITEDITTLSLNDYLEAKKFVNTVTYELYVHSGTPTTYSLDFNYGYAKYEDFGNNDFTLTGIECIGLAGATDTNFDIVLYHHSPTGWIYAATGFEAGGTEIASMFDDLNPYDNLTNGIDFAWKRVGLNYYIDGSDSEGVIVKIVCGANNSVQSMDIHLGSLFE